MRITTIINGKGGVGKTTTAQALGTGLNKLDHTKTLAIDYDPQGNLSFAYGAEVISSPTMYHVINGDISIRDAIQHTPQGDITVKALTAAAPCTTFSFRYLAEHGYYDDTHCHRLTTQRLWVLQCGDPTGTGSGGPGYSFNDENLAGATYPAGTVAMANAGPNTNGSQFFFTWQDTKLRPDYTPFGVVTSGMDVLQKIAAAGEDDQNAPGDGYPNDYVLFRNVHVHTNK